MEDDASASFLYDSLVVLNVAWISLKVLVRAKLYRIYEDRNDGAVILARRFLDENSDDLRAEIP